MLHQGWSPRCEPEPSNKVTEWAALKTTAIQDGWFDESFNKRLPNALKPRPALEVHPRDILITCAGPRVRCGVACLVIKTRPRLMISGKMYRFRADESVVTPEFLLAYLRSPEGQAAIDRMKTGGSESGLKPHATKDRIRVPAGMRQYHRPSLVGGLPHGNHAELPKELSLRRLLETRSAIRSLVDGS